MSCRPRLQVRDRAIVRPLGSARIRGNSEVTVYAVDGIKTEKGWPALARNGDSDPEQRQKHAAVIHRCLINYLKWFAGLYPAFFRFSLLKNHNLLPISL
jgi:hypothetical protein